MGQRVTKVKKKTVNGYTEAIPIGAKAEDITLQDGTILQDVIDVLATGQAGHEELTRAQYEALSQSKKKDGTVYFVEDGTITGSENVAAAISYNNNVSQAAVSNVQSAIDDLYNKKINYTDVVNGLNNTSTNLPLSAAQGKALNDSLTSLTNKIKGPYQSYSQLYTALSQLSTGEPAVFYMNANPAMAISNNQIGYSFKGVVGRSGTDTFDFFGTSGAGDILWTVRATLTIDSATVNYIRKIALGGGVQAQPIIKRATYTYTYSLASGASLAISSTNFNATVPSGYQTLAVCSADSGNASVVISSLYPTNTSKMMTIKNTTTSTQSGTATLAIAYINSGNFSTI